MSFETLTQALDSNTHSDRFISYLRSNNEESSVSLGDLKQRALGILFNLQQHGIQPGEQLIIFTDNNEFFLDAFWAALYGGIIPVPVASATNDEHRNKLLRIFNKLESPWLYTNKKAADQIQSYGESKGLTNDVTQLAAKTLLIDEINDISVPGIEHDVKADDVAFIQFSSGSTSEPKGVVLTHKNIMTNIAAIIDAAHFTNDDVFFSWMPLTHDMGMIGYHLTPVTLGIDHTIMDTSVFVRRPLLWLTAASNKKASILCSPNFGYKHFLKVFEAKGLEDIDLSNVRLIFNGAEPISKAISDQFLEAMQPYGLKSNTMFPVYGLAEASLAVSFPVPGAAVDTISLNRTQLAVADKTQETNDESNAMEFVYVGTPINECHVRIADMDNQALADGYVGKIQLKGDNVTKGYYLEDEINKQLITEDNWLDTGDLGAFINGQMIITGRLKDIIFVNGLNFYSHDIENILHDLEELELGKVVATGARKPDSSEDELIIFILYRGDIETFMPLASLVRQTVNEITGVEIRHVIPIKRIPKTTSGKVQRHILNNEYIDGEYDDVLTAMSALLESAKNSDKNTVDDNSIEAVVLNICNTTVTDKEISLDDNLFEIGISSLSLAEIHEQLEQNYPGLVDISDLFDHPTVRLISTFLENKK